MVNREMVEQIVIDVLNKLSVHKEVFSKSNMLIVPGEEEVESSLLQQLDTKWNISIYDGGRNIAAERIVFLQVDQNFLVKAAIGIADTDKCEYVTYCMEQGLMIIFILADGFKQFLNKCKNEEYKSLFNRYIKTLEGYGVSFLTIEQLISSQKETKQMFIFQGKVLSYADVQSCKDPIIMISKKTIVTPLAKDTVRELGKEIVFMEHNEVM